MEDRAAAVRLAERLRTLASRLEGGTADSAALQRLEQALTQWEQEIPAPEPLGRGNGDYAVWCDGSCAPNPGPGGWGTIVEHAGERRELAGASMRSTNNIMELTAAIEGLRHTPPGATVHCVTDSRYLKDGITQWLPRWKRRGWRKADGEPVLNRELWQTLDALAAERTVTWEWVRGHAGHPENERCDALANQARRDLTAGQGTQSG